MVDAKIEKRNELKQIAIDSGFDPEELSRLPTWQIENMLKSIPKPIEIVPDDGATVIDMPSKNEDKFARLEWLLQKQEMMKKAIHSNKLCFETYIDQWEKDDLLAIKKEIDYSTICLNSIGAEIDELKAYFATQRAQKLNFYNEHVTQLVDVSNNLGTHFQNKMQLLNHQLKTVDQLH